MPKKIVCKEITWLDDEIHDGQNMSDAIHHYKKFQFKNIIAEVGDFVLISNADAAEPDTEEGCDVAKILSLYEDSTHKSDPYRAKVQWYSKHHDLPSWCFNNIGPIIFLDKEVIEDHRPFDTDVSIETFFKKCSITFTFTRDVDVTLNDTSYHYICRYRLLSLSKRRVQIEPVLEEERRAIEILFTPKKNNTSPKHKTPRTPSTLIKKMSRVSISEKKNWSISKNEGTKMLLKRNIFSENNNSTPRNKRKTPQTTPTYTETPRSTRKLTKNNTEDIVSMELRENPNEDLPTLIIRQHVPNTPKRKSSISKTSENTPRKMLIFDDEEMDGFKVTTTRSGRVTRNPRNYREEDISPVKRTMKKSMHRMDTDSDEDFKPVPSTSKTPKNPNIARSTPTRTPKRSVSKKTYELTPTLHSRVHSVDNSNGFLNENKSLPGREQQLGEILAFVRSNLLNKASGCMYISGVPGTGKTATVCTAMKILKEEVDLPDFQLVEVNGMKIAEPRQAYVQIYKQLTGKSVVSEQACSLLEKRFNNPGPRRTPTVLLVDELDALCTRRQDVLYSIMEWATHKTALLTVLTVANTMDLPERALAARVASRLGLTRLTFPPYTHTQLQHIVAMRLADANVSCDAVQLIARKVAAISGDARRALALCDRALELSENRQAGLREVQQALGEATSSVTIRAIRNCSPAERLMLRAVAAEVERTGSDETTLSRALATAAAIVTLDGRPYKSAVSVRAPTSSQAQALCARLAANKLLLMEPKGAECRLLLNVSADDVYYATKQITV